MEIPVPDTKSLRDLLDWRRDARLIISPKFQRRGVWSAKQRSYFIDTILQEMPSPPIYLRRIFDNEREDIVHEVIDGQQRLSAVLDFYDGKFAISRNLKEPYSGKKFDKLTKEERARIMSYKFNAAAFEGISDTEVYGIFRRMNTYASPLTKQELRHGNFFGPFSRTAEGLAAEHRPFWEANKVVSYGQMTRMVEVQLTAELLILQMAGLQDKKKSIDDFYREYDEELPGEAKLARDFRTTMEAISDSIGETLIDSQFRRPTFFYTLYGVVYHRIFGLPGIDDLKTRKKPLAPDEQESLRDAVTELSRAITIAKEEQRVVRDQQPDDRDRESRVPRKFTNFTRASTSQTDNKHPREARLRTLYGEAFN